MYKYAFSFSIGFLSLLRSCQVSSQANPTCLQNEFSDIVLVIVYNYPFYSSVPTLKALYKNAFPNIMFCGPKKAKNDAVEALYIRKGYFSYTCLSRAMEKHPGYAGYLLINDDVMLNYWNLIGLKRDKIWEGPKEPISFKNYSLPERWYWWNSTWGMKQCQKAYDEIWAMQESNLDDWQPEMLHEYTGNERTHTRTVVWDVKTAVSRLRKNGNGTRYCYHGRSDVFYIPGKFAEGFNTLSYIFYKHGSFLEIAVPTICRMLDVEENFEYIPGVYLPGRSGEPPVRKAQHFWEVYDKKLAFIHPFKLNYTVDGALNSILLKNWIIEYSNGLSLCERN